MMSDQSDHKSYEGENSNRAGTEADDEKCKHFIRSEYTDIMVKVDTDVYHLDRLQLVLNSDYFEQLFTKDFDEKKRSLIDIPLMDSETFSTIVDIIYGENLDSVMNADNYVSLLMAMDYLQMEINLNSIHYFIAHKLKWQEMADVKIFNLYHFIQGNSNFEPLLQSVFHFLSENLTNVQKNEELLSLPFDHFIQIIMNFQVDKYSLRDITEKHEISEACAEWICHDVENRLSHVVKLVNAAKRRFRYPNDISDENLIVKLPVNIDESTKREIVAARFYRLLTFYGEIIADRETPKTDEDEESYFDKIPSISVLNENKKNKLSNFLENGHFHDIVIRVEEKTYQLHRSILKSATGYFEAICSSKNTESSGNQCEGTSVCLNKDDEYFLAEIDQATFDLIIDYIYFGKINKTGDNIARLVKTADMLGIEKLLKECESWLESCYKTVRVNSEGVIEILNFLYGKSKYENVYMRYLCLHVRRNWPKIGNMLQFCSISCRMLEDMLVSQDFFLNDARIIVDICSRWIIHDVRNRYRLLPRIAIAINCNRMIDYDNYEIEIPADFTTCSQQFVRDKLMEILSSTTLIPSTTTMAIPQKRKFEEKEPVFITSMRDDTCNWSDSEGRFCDKSFHILDDKCDEIATLWMSQDLEDNRKTSISFPMAATMVGDNLFILCDVARDTPSIFQVYNSTSRKFTALNSDPRLTSIYIFRSSEFALLNCQNEVYYCCESGLVLKYSILLNRWMTISRSEKSKNKILFASDGEILYRIHNISENKSTFSYLVETYNFEQKLWISVPDLPVISDRPKPLKQLTIINGRDLAVLFESVYLTSDRLSRTWREFSLPREYHGSIFKTHTLITQSGDDILYIFDKKLYQFSRSNQSWELKLEMPEKSGFMLGDSAYRNIISVHRPTVRIN